MKLDEYLSHSPALNALHARVKEDFLERRLVHHNWNHILRDLGRGITIGEEEGAEMKRVLASILLHDIGRLYPELGEDHHSVGAKAWGFWEELDQELAAEERAVRESFPIMWGISRHMNLRATRWI